MADETLPGGTQPDDANRAGEAPLADKNQPAPASGHSDGAGDVGRTAGVDVGEKPNDGSDPMPHRGELEQVGAGADKPGPTADGNQTGAGTSDARAVAPAAESVLSDVKVEPAAKVGPVTPGGPRTGGGGGGVRRRRVRRRRRGAGAAPAPTAAAAGLAATGTGATSPTRRASRAT